MSGPNVVSTPLAALEKVEDLLDELIVRVNATVRSRKDAEYIESGIRTAKNALYAAMRGEVAR